MRWTWRHILFGGMISLAAGGAVHITTPYPFPRPLHFPPPNGGIPVITQEAVELGRHLFYDERLSANGNLSCGSCLRQDHAFSDAGNTFSLIAVGGHTARNTMPLFNLVWFEAFGWDGRSSSLEEQVEHAMEDEMASDMRTAVQRVSDDPIYQTLFSKAYGRTPEGGLAVDAISQFLRTIVSHRSKYDRVLAREDLFTHDEYQGFVLVNDQSMGNCLHCHVTDAHALGTTGGFSNNGLDSMPADPGVTAITGDPKDAGRFRIPSLRNVALTAPYMHDGRFATLEEVLDHYAEGAHGGPHTDTKLIVASPGDPLLTDTERRQIIAFLHTLPDSSFIKDPAFSDPFAATR